MAAVVTALLMSSLPTMSMSPMVPLRDDEAESILAISPNLQNPAAGGVFPIDRKRAARRGRMPRLVTKGTLITRGNPPKIRMWAS